MIPSVGYHVPEFPERYNIYEVKDITVYVKKNVNTDNDKLEFFTNSFLFLTTLEVRGVKV
ncbi:MAG: hypothetical protein WBA54_08845 [Acidaminobacteraceae bacterium]